MRERVVLITGASGEIGHGLIERLAASGRDPIVTLDIAPLDPAAGAAVHREVHGSILDTGTLDRLLAAYEVDRIFHLAALLSTRAEFAPTTAHAVNVGGTLNLLDFAQRQTESHGRSVTFLYPSSVAAFGLPDLATKRRVGAVAEDQWNQPSTMYGCNKLSCEHLGRYYAQHYKQLLAERPAGRVDFRSVRLPGLISVATTPSGGTSDYAPEMIHAAARAEPYVCFVRPDTRMPFMVMPDAIDALLALAVAPREALSRTTYNVRAFAPTAGEIRAETLRAFPGASIAFDVDPGRQHIADSWPADLDDSAARRDWGFAPAYDLPRGFHDYLIPGIRRKYA